MFVGVQNWLEHFEELFGGFGCECDEESDQECDASCFEYVGYENTEDGFDHIVRSGSGVALCRG